MAKALESWSPPGFNFAFFTMLLKSRLSKYCVLLGVLSLIICSFTATGAAVSLRPPSSVKATPDNLVAFITKKGTFRPAETPVRGGFRIRKEDMKFILELSSDFKTNDLAPDLKIAFGFSRTPLATSSPPAYPLTEGSYTVVAPLQATSGAQVYVIPRSIDLARQGSLLIWCEKFNATMAWAPLN